MSDKVRKAAERLRRTRGSDYVTLKLVYGDNGEQLQQDMMEIADAYLAEHPADDDEPITNEWLTSFGRHFEFNGHELAINSDGGVELWTHWGGESVVIDLCDVATRGDVRRLLRGLGIKLPEKGE